MGKWQEVEGAETSASQSGAYVVTTLAAGDGPIVEVGDLVKAKVQPIRDPIPVPTPSQKEPDAQTVWVWTGHEPQFGDPHERGVDLGTFGNLGTPRARAALVGRRLHERFEMRLEPGAEHTGDELPLRGVIDFRFSRMRHGGEIAGQRVVQPGWPALPLAATPMSRPAAQIEILNVCKAKLLRRTATLNQYGVIFATGEVRYASARKGTLGWTAIEAQCPAPDRKVRFQAGPFHHTGDASDGTWLADWSSSYVRLRPPERYPEEWEVVPKPLWMIYNERMEPISKTIVDLDLAQRGADFHCQVSRKCEAPEQATQRHQQRDRLLKEAAVQRKALECELEKKCE